MHVWVFYVQKTNQWSTPVHFLQFPQIPTGQSSSPVRAPLSQSTSASSKHCQRSQFSKYQVPYLISHTHQISRCPHLTRKKKCCSPPMTLHARLIFQFCLFYFVTEFLWLVPTSNSLTHPHFSLQADCLPRTPVQCRSFPMCSRDHTHHRQHDTRTCPYFLKPQLLWTCLYCWILKYSFSFLSFPFFMLLLAPSAQPDFAGW